MIKCIFLRMHWMCRRKFLAAIKCYGGDNNARNQLIRHYKQTVTVAAKTTITNKIYQKKEEDGDEQEELTSICAALRCLSASLHWARMFLLFVWKIARIYAARVCEMRSDGYICWHTAHFIFVYFSVSSERNNRCGAGEECSVPVLFCIFLLFFWWSIGGVSMVPRGERHRKQLESELFLWLRNAGGTYIVSHFSLYAFYPNSGSLYLHKQYLRTRITN